MSTFDIDAVVYSNVELSDQAVRDIYARNVQASSSTLVGNTDTLTTKSYALLNSGTGEKELIYSTTLTGTDGTYETTPPSLTWEIYDTTTGVTEKVFEVTSSGATFFQNLTVKGTSTTINSDEISIADISIQLGEGVTTTENLDGAGIVFGESMRSILYSAARDAFEVNASLSVISGTDIVDLTPTQLVLTSSTDSATLSPTGLITGDYSATTSGFSYIPSGSTLSYDATNGRWDLGSTLRAPSFLATGTNPAELTTDGFRVLASDTISTTSLLRDALTLGANAYVEGATGSLRLGATTGTARTEADSSAVTVIDANDVSSSLTADGITSSTGATLLVDPSTVWTFDGTRVDATEFRALTSGSHLDSNGVWGDSLGLYGTDTVGIQYCNELWVVGDESSADPVAETVPMRLLKNGLYRYDEASMTTDWTNIWTFTEGVAIEGTNPTLTVGTSVIDSVSGTFDSILVGNNAFVADANGTVTGGVVVSSTTSTLSVGDVSLDATGLVVGTDTTMTSTGFTAGTTMSLTPTSLTMGDSDLTSGSLVLGATTSLTETSGLLVDGVSLTNSGLSVGDYTLTTAGLVGTDISLSGTSFTMGDAFSLTQDAIRTGTTAGSGIETTLAADRTNAELAIRTGSTLLVEGTSTFEGDATFNGTLTADGFIVTNSSADVVDGRVVVANETFVLGTTDVPIATLDSTDGLTMGSTTVGTDGTLSLDDATNPIVSIAGTTGVSVGTTSVTEGSFNTGSTSGILLDTSGLTVGDVTATTSQVSIGTGFVATSTGATMDSFATTDGKTAIDSTGINLSFEDGSGALYMGPSKQWRIVYDATDDAISFERWDSATGAYVQRLAID